MVAAGRHRLLQLPRGADKQFDTDRVPLPRYQSLAAHATAAEPERLDNLGADQAVGRRLAPETANPSSVAREALRRQTPKVGAVCPNWARTDLCGGREVTRVPTAKVISTLKTTRLTVKTLSERDVFGEGSQVECDCSLFGVSQEVPLIVFHPHRPESNLSTIFRLGVIIAADLALA
jgi:hypothetical protein